MQPESSVPQEQPKAPKKSNFMTVVAVILVLALAGAGFWGFQQSSALKATQAELATAKEQNKSLTAEKNELSSNLDSTTSELEATKEELATTQSDLEKARSENTTLRASMDKAGKWVEVAIAFIVEDDNDATTEKVKATGDSKLKSLWDTFQATPLNLSDASSIIKWSTNLNAFENYLLKSIAEFLK